MKSAVRRVLLMSALMSPSALFALGLGEIRLNSALNQPFDAEIELVSAAQEDLAALRASLASSETFVRYGLEKPSFLAEFSFRVARANGRDVLRVTSSRPVSEPFVTLLVEASWPRGRLLREYTVLLDPPVYAPEPEGSAAPVATPRAAGPAEPPAAAAPAPEARSAPGEPRVSRPVTIAPSVDPGTTYRVQPNDTLWKIASAANPGPRSEINRAMVAIYQANPQAFGGNINVLRAGSELRIPASADIASISASAAADEVARQYQMWRDGTSSAAPESDGGRLRLVTPEQGTAAPSTATSAPAVPEAAADLQSRVQQLEAELAEARRLLEVRNAELATLQGGVAPGDAVAPEAEPADGQVPAEGTDATQGVAETPDAVTPEPTVEPEPEPAPSAVAPAEPSPSLLERVGQYWWALLALLVAALGVAALLRRRRESGTTEDSLEEALGRRAGDDLRSRTAVIARPREADILVEERHATDTGAARTATLGGVAGLAPEPSRKPVSIEDTLSGEGPVSIETGDPLAEADFHMAYGLYDQAADLVQLAAKREPHRRDLKVKLLEIFFVWGNRDRFLELAREMNASKGAGPAGEWDKILIMGKQLAPDDPLFAGGVRASAGDSLDMDLQGSDAAVDVDLLGGDGPAPDLDLTARAAKVDSEDGLDFMLDEPLRGATDESDALAPTIEAQRIRPASGDDPTAEVSIEDLGLDVGELEGLDGIGEADDLLAASKTIVEDTIERPTIGREGADAEEDLLSSTSILSPEAMAEMDATSETRTELLDLSDATGELPTIETARLESTGILKRVDFPLDGGESSTMSEVGTKLDLARAYIDMGDPEGARSILDEVLKEGSAVQKQEAERLMASLP